MDCHTPPQGIFLTHRSNPGLLHYRQIPYHLNHQDKNLKSTTFNMAYLSLLQYPMLLLQPHWTSWPHMLEMIFFQMIIWSILLFNSFLSEFMWGFPYTLCVKEEMPPRCDYLSFPAFFMLFFFFFPYRPIKLVKNGAESYFNLEDFLFF